MRKTALMVKTFQTADLIIPDYKVVLDLYATGGSEDAMVANLIAKKLNPFARAVDAPVTFWSKIRDVKAGEEGSITYSIPSYFNGSMKVMAVAVSNDRVGSSETAFIARMPVVLTPNMPYSAVPGDKFQLSVGVANVMEQGGSSEEFKITAEPSKHLEIIGDKTKTVSVKNGGEAVIKFDVLVKDELGGAEINLTTENRNLDEALKTRITTSVRPAVPYRFDMQMGTFKGKSETIKKGLDRKMYDFYTSRKGGVSASPLWSLSGLLGYLETYPYGCTEQITSKVYPVILLASVDPSADKQLVKEKYDVVISELRKRQKGTRGFTLWSGGSYVDDLASIYAMQFLTDAKELGYKVPGEIFEKGISFLKNKANEYPNYYYDAYEIAYASYILARNGVVVTRSLNVLTEFINKNMNNSNYKYARDYYNLANALIGASYILLKNDEVGMELLKNSVPEDRRNYVFYSDYYDTMLNQARYLYLIGRHAPSLVKDNLDMVDNILNYAENGYFNSFSSAFALAALKGIGSDKEKLTAVITGSPDGSVKVDSNNKNLFTFTEEAKSVSVEYPENNDLGYYYYITTGGFDKEIPDSYSNGISIRKRFLDKNNKEITEGKQGDEVTVELEIRRLENKGDYSLNTAVTDLLPGGVEILTDKGVKGSNIQYHDFREDRAVIYLNLSREYKGKLTYKIKLLSSGEFTVPPAYIESLYRRSVNGMSSSSKFVIRDGK